MENVQCFDQRAQIINELLQGLNFVKQLQKQINKNKTTSSLCDNDNQKHKYSSLIEKMMSTFDKTITIANQINHSNPNNNSFDVRSPLSENSQPNLRPSKRRKMITKWTKTVEISPDITINGLEGPLDDGFSWRKYGQKGIFRATFPRGYYRCTHRDSKGCPAKKQVQRSDDNPFIYQVMYRGEHTCYPRPNFETSQAQISSNIAHQPNFQTQQHSPISQPTVQEIFVGLSPEGDLEIGPNEMDNKAQIFRCFSFKSALLEAEPLDNYILSCSSDFASPSTSGSNYFPTSPCAITLPSVGLKVQTSDSDINDLNSGQNSVNNSPTLNDFEFSLGQWLDLDPDLF